MAIICIEPEGKYIVIMDRDAFLRTLSPLKSFLTSDAAEIDVIIQKAYDANPWFIPEFSRLAITAIAEKFLDEATCAAWIAKYPLPAGQKSVALVMAGNIPMVGFHDLFCVLASGHAAQVKCSDRDSLLLPFITEQWINIEPSLASRISFVQQPNGFDAVMATGSNNSARYFEYYFRSYPHILRQNRNGVAILTGEESGEELKALAKDIFLFFGLGCRNVSSVWVPQGYDFGRWEEAIVDWAYLADHHKYKNNLEYNYAIYLINQVPHLHLGHLILKEDDAIASRIGCVHYRFYSEMDSIADRLEEQRDLIQCVMSAKPIRGWEHIRFGESQSPDLAQYADGVDTMQFLASI